MPNLNRLRALSGQSAIVGVAESDQIGNVPDKSPLAHHAEAAINALDDAGIVAVRCGWVDDGGLVNVGCG